MSRVAQPTGLKPADITTGSTKNVPVTGDKVVGVNSEAGNELMLIPVGSLSNTVEPDALAEDDLIYWDGFEDTELTRLAAHDGEINWTENRGVWTIVGGELEATSSPSQWSYAFGPTLQSTNHFAQCDVIGSASNIGVFCKGTIDNISYGAFYAARMNGFVRLYKVNFVGGGAAAAILLETVVVSGDTGLLRIESRGGRVLVFLDGVQHIDFTDTSVTNGTSCGVMSWPGTTPGLIDDFVCGDLQLYKTAQTTIGTDDCNIFLPKGYNTADGAHLVVYCHSNNGDETEPVSNPRAHTNVAHLLSEGYIVASSYMGGNNWGNQASQDALLALWNYCNQQYSIRKTVILSQSMGGMAGLSSYLDGLFPRAVGWAGVVPAVNLATMFGSNDLIYSPFIRAAYGIAGDGSDYTTQTAGYDPVLKSPGKYLDKRFRFYSSPGDTLVPAADNSDVASARAVAAGATESVVVPHTGGHNDESAYQPDDLLAFFARCVSN